MKYCFSFCLVLKAVFLLAQDPNPPVQDPADTTVYEREKIEVPGNYFIPTGVRFGTDLISDIRGFRSATFDGWEFNADVDFYRYYLTMEYGRWAQIHELGNGWYDNAGKYLKLGVDVNFLRKDPDRNMFFLGIRYCRSSFSDSVSYSYNNDRFGDIQTNIVNSGLTGTWYELTTGLRVKIWKFIWLGYTGRLKLIPRVKGEGNLQTFEIPGYGLAAPKPSWGFSYQLYFRIPLRKAPPPLVK